jgi:hypothetical protein
VTAEADPRSVSRGRRSDGAALLGALKATGTTGAAVFALVASAVALAFSIWPSLSPDPRNVLAASMQVETLEPGVTLGDYFERIGEDPERLSPSVRGAEGLLAYVKLRIEGRKHGTLRIEQVRYAKRTGRRLSKQVRRVTTVGADTPNDQWIHRVFVLVSPYSFPVFVRLELYDDDILLAYADTPTLPR